jgi:DNA mismatch repair ATPase MutS
MDKNLIITGPNASGKTTTLKTALINVILTQQFGCGFYKSGNMMPYQHIHCYLNIPDTSGRDSLFQAEARRCKDIIDVIKANKKDRHFCVFDELYSGTNPDEAVMSANAFMEYLVKFENVKCILTTHFIAVCKKLSSHSRIENYQMETTPMGDSFNYTYVLKKGISEVRGGIKVLHDMQYPDEIIQNSKFKNDEK